MSILGKRAISKNSIILDFNKTPTKIENTFFLSFYHWDRLRNFFNWFFFFLKFLSRSETKFWPISCRINLKSDVILIYTDFVLYLFKQTILKIWETFLVIKILIWYAVVIFTPNQIVYNYVVVTWWNTSYRVMPMNFREIILKYYTNITMILF